MEGYGRGRSNSGGGGNGGGRGRGRSNNRGGASGGGNGGGRAWNQHNRNQGQFSGQWSGSRRGVDQSYSNQDQSSGQWSGSGRGVDRSYSNQGQSSGQWSGRGVDRSYSNQGQSSGQWSGSGSGRGGDQTYSSQDQYSGNRSRTGRGGNPPNVNQGQFSGYGKTGRGHEGGSSSDGVSSRGRGRGEQIMKFVPIGSQSSDPIVDPLTSKMQSIGISEPLPENSGITPMKRPDKGGQSAVRSVQLLVNHFPVKFNPKRTIFHYDIDIKPEVQPRHGGTIEISKSDMTMIKNKFFSDDPARFPLSKIAHDKEKSIFSAVLLPTGTFRVMGTNARTYLFMIKLVKELDLYKLEAYLNGSLPSIPRDILQGMDLVMKENPSRRQISIGRSFYSMKFNNDDDLGGGIFASRGFQHSFKVTSQGLVQCVDYSVLPFLKSVPVLQFLCEHLRIKFNEGKRLENWEKENIEVALRGLRVMVTHRQTKQKYTIVGLTEATSNNLTFMAEDPDGKTPPREVRLVDYFRDKYEEIRYKHLPCLDFSRNNKMNYVPMEFCVLLEGQRYPKENLDWESANHLKGISLAKPWVRMNFICNIVRSRDGPRGGEIAENFDITVSTEMTQVTGRVIRPPDLKLGDVNGKASKYMPDKEDRQWNLVDRSVLEGKQIERWAVLDLTSSSNVKLIPKRFIDLLRARCAKLNIHMKPPLLCESSRMDILSNTNRLHDLLKKINQRAEQNAGGRLQILICVMTRRDNGYNNLKRISETEIGMLTQCCLVSHANACKDQYLANLGLKINAKLGGSNVELFDRLPRLEGDGHVMFIGADVNHPGPRNTLSPSIASIVATMNWPAANRYAGRIRPQENRKESIQNFGEICMELIKTYARLNKVKPEKIVVFRDGVSESQFDMALNDELMDLKKAIESDGYSPTITFVVARKRHQTRLFPKDRNQGANTGNVFPGTVVDTTIVDLHDFNFYLCSHYGSIGTSKPTHYTVLYDEHGFTSDEMQRLIYNMCYTFARCTKPVSLVPPVYYADLLAYRGRLYHDSLMGSHSPASMVSSCSTLSPASSSSSPSSSSSLYDHNRFFKAHVDLENVMFFC